MRIITGNECRAIPAARSQGRPCKTIITFITIQLSVRYGQLKTQQLMAQKENFSHHWVDPRARENWNKRTATKKRVNKTCAIKRVQWCSWVLNQFILIQSSFDIYTHRVTGGDNSFILPLELMKARGKTRGLIKLIQRLLLNTLVHLSEPEIIGIVPKQHPESSFSFKINK